MKSEKEIRDKLGEYKWYFENIIETPETKGYIEALEWILKEDDFTPSETKQKRKRIISTKNFFTDKPLLPPLEKRTDKYSKMMQKSLRLLKLFDDLGI